MTMIYSLYRYFTNTYGFFGPIRTREPPIAQCLPLELLLEIFRWIPYAPAPYRDTIIYPYLESGEHDRTASPRDARASLPLVCQQWNGPATEILYEEVEVSSLHAAKILLRTLEGARGPALGEMIKTLRLPARADVARSRMIREPFPHTVTEITEGIMCRCSSSLKSLAYSTAATQRTLGLFWEPRFPAGTMLTGLHLFNSYSLDGAPILSLEAHRHLRAATLTAFIFDRPAGALKCPASLESLTLTSCTFDYGWDIHHPDPAVLTSLAFNICTFIDSLLPAYLLEHLAALEIYRTPSLSYDLSHAPNLTSLALAPSQDAPRFGWGNYVPHGLRCLTLGIFDPHDIRDLEVLILPLARELELVQVYICCRLDAFEKTCLERVTFHLHILGIEKIKVIWDSRVEEWSNREWLFVARSVDRTCHRVR